MNTPPFAGENAVRTSIAVGLLRAIGTYLFVVVGGTSLFLFLAPIIGYIPSGDRPGEGWSDLFPDVSVGQVVDHAYFVGGWAVFLSLYAVVLGVFFFLVIRAIEYINVPRLGVQIIGAGLAGFLSGYLVLGIGWYIAIGQVAVYVSVVLGACWGAWLLPGKRARHTE